MGWAVELGLEFVVGVGVILGLGAIVEESQKLPGGSVIGVKTELDGVWREGKVFSSKITCREI